MSHGSNSRGASTICTWRLQLFSYLPAVSRYSVLTVNYDWNYNLVAISRCPC